MGPEPDQVDKTPATLHTGTSEPLILPIEVIDRLPGIDDLDRKLLDPNFSALTLINSQLATMSATQLRDLLKTKHAHLLAQVEEMGPPADVEEICPVDVSRLDDMRARASVLMEQAAGLDEQLAASRARIVQILKLRDTLMKVSSTLNLCRVYVSQVSSLPTSLDKFIADIPSAAQRLAYIRLIEDLIQPYASIPAISTCRTQFVAFTHRLKEYLVEVQGSPLENAATFWEDALPHVALGTILYDHENLATVVINRSNIFLESKTTISNEIQSLTASVALFQNFIEVSTPYLAKLDYEVSSWVRQARSNVEIISEVSLISDICCSSSLLIIIYKCYISTVLKKLSRLLKVVTMESGDAAFQDAANTFVAFEVCIRQSSLCSGLVTHFPQLGQPIQDGLFVPLFSSLVLDNLDSNINRLQSVSVSLFAELDFASFNLCNNCPPPQAFAILKEWKTFLQRMLPFLNSDMRLYVSEAILQCMQDVSAALIRKLDFSGQTNQILHNKYARMGDFPVQHSLIARKACHKMTIYDPGELLVVTPSQTVTATIYAVLWAAVTLESNIVELMDSYLGIDNASSGTYVQSSEKSDITNSDALSLHARREGIVKKLQELWSSTLDLAMRTLAGVIAGELCSGGIFPLLDAQPSAKQDFKHAQVSVTSQLELFCESFKSTALPSLFAELLVSSVCNVAGCCTIAHAPKTADSLINVLSAMKDLTQDMAYIVSNAAPSRLYDTVSKCVEEKFVGILSFLLLVIDSPKSATVKQLMGFLPDCNDPKKWLGELTYHWQK